MDFEPSAQQESARRAFAELLARACPVDVVRAAEPLGFDEALWRAVAPHAASSAAGALLDGALAAEQAGRVAAPAPFAEVVAATRLLARLQRPPETGTVVTLAPNPAADGTASLVPAGAVARAAVVLDDDRLVLVEREPPGRAPPNLGSSPLADVDATGGEVLATGEAARALHAAAADEWRVLTAAALVGLADGALALALERVRTRVQFGTPIGAFQAVQHRLADLVTDLVGARALAYEAAWAVDEQPARAPALAAMAFAWCGRTAQAVTTDSLHFHGGYGFTLAFDVQLYFRRAKAWTLALGDAELELARVADRLYGPARAPAPGPSLAPAPVTTGGA